MVDVVNAQSKDNLIANARVIIDYLGRQMTLEIFDSMGGTYDDLYGESKVKQYTPQQIKGKVTLNPSEQVLSEIGAKNTEVDILVTVVSEDVTPTLDDRFNFGGVYYDIVKIIPSAQYGEDYLITKILGKRV